MKLYLKLRFVALVSFAVAAMCLILCIKVYVKGAWWLKPGVTFNQDVVNDLVGMVQSATFGMIPELSVLLIMNSVVIWIISKKVDDTKKAKSAQP